MLSGCDHQTRGTDPVNSGLDIDAFTSYLGSRPALAPPAADRVQLLS